MSRVYVYSTVVLASVALACEQGQSRESRLHLYFSSPQEGRGLIPRPVHRLPMPSLGRSERRTFPPVPDETNCHLCFKDGVHFRIQTGAERIVKKHTTQAVSHWSCRWISFWKGKLLSIMVNINARLAGSKTELKSALESVQV